MRINDLLFVKVNEDCYIPFYSEKSGTNALYRNIYKSQFREFNYSFNEDRSNLFYSSVEIQNLLQYFLNYNILKTSRTIWQYTDLKKMANKNFSAALPIEDIFQRPYFLIMEDKPQKFYSFDSLESLIIKTNEDKVSKRVKPFCLYKIKSAIFFIGRRNFYENGVHCIQGVDSIITRKYVNTTTCNLVRQNILYNVLRNDFKRFNSLKEAQANIVIDKFSDRFAIYEIDITNGNVYCYSEDTLNKEFVFMCEEYRDDIKFEF